MREVRWHAKDDKAESQERTEFFTALLNFLAGQAEAASTWDLVLEK